MTEQEYQTDVTQRPARRRGRLRLGQQAIEQILVGLAIAVQGKPAGQQLAADGEHPLKLAPVVGMQRAHHQPPGAKDVRIGDPDHALRPHGGQARRGRA